MLPLVLDLPIRFNDAPNGKAREQGVFKHTRGILRGWDLPEEKEERISNIDSETNQIVLKLRPRCLHIEVPCASAKLEKNEWEKDL